jgi:hypothetical protein
MDIHLRRRFKALTRVVAAAAVLAATASVPETALAQQVADPSGITGFAGGSVLFTIQPLAPPAGGDPAWGLRAKAASVSAVLGVGRQVGIDFEITRGPEQTASVQFRCCGGTASDSAILRETFVSAFVRWRRGQLADLRIEPVAGLTFSSGNGTVIQNFKPDAPGSVDLPGYPAPFSKRSLGFGGGVDVVLPIGSSLAAVGSFRVHRLIWDDLYHLYSPSLDVSHWVVQFGGGLRFSTRPSGVDRTPPQTSASRHDTGGAPSRRGYAGLLAFLSTQPTGYADGHYLSAGLGGTGFGGGGIVGGFLKPHVSVEAEARVGPSLTAEQWSTYRYRYATVYRDTLFSGFVRWHRRPFQRNLLEPVLGISVAAARAARTAVSYSYPGSLAGPASDSSVTRISLGVGGGADLVVPVGKGIAAVASFRLHVMKRNDQREGVPELGISRFVYHFGGGLQWSF